ncbi:MAG: ABC transporter permease [Candidatus Competibacteraceae bacterium]|nr:ABC transporter permease [Candidatus Competibacteraceae bacterium]MCB1815661.1 ABC transporter permease [Candidatus Competibacteraceae bacterium]
MTRYILQRLLSAIPVLLIVSLVSFLIIWLVPGDAASEMAGPTASIEEIERVRQQMGLDRPFYQQLLQWYGQLLQGDLGHSFLLNRSVVTAIAERAPVTLSLTLLALFIMIVLGVSSGVLAAVRHNTWVDQSLMTLALLGMSLPDFWLGLVLIYSFAVLLGWLPTGGYIPFSEDMLGWLRTMTLPALTLAFTQMGLLARMTRSSMLEVLRQDYVRTARAKGLPEWLIIAKHAFANVLVPVVTVTGLSVGILLGGAVVIESVFSLPGIGRLIIGAILRRDIPVIQGGLLLTASAFVFVNIIVDILYAYLDPRVRYEHS